MTARRDLPLPDVMHRQLARGGNGPWMYGPAFADGGAGRWRTPC